MSHGRSWSKPKTDRPTLAHAGSPIDGERRNAFVALARTMRSDGVTWSDLGNAIETGGNADCEGKYTEAEMQEFAQASRAEGVETGIKIGMTRAGNGGNGHLSLPKPSEMAAYCHDRLSQLKDGEQRRFITEVFLNTQHGGRLQRGPLGYLASLYIKHGGRT